MCVCVSGRTVGAQPAPHSSALASRWRRGRGASCECLGPPRPLVRTHTGPTRVRGLLGSWGQVGAPVDISVPTLPRKLFSFPVARSGGWVRIASESSTGLDARGKGCPRWRGVGLQVWETWAVRGVGSSGSRHSSGNGALSEFGLLAAGRPRDCRPLASGSHEWGAQGPAGEPRTVCSSSHVEPFLFRFFF